MKTKTGDTKFAKIIHETEKLINAGHLIVNSSNRRLILVESFWVLMDKEGQDNFIRNMAVYCKLKNAYDGILEDNYQELLLMIKDNSQKINYFYRFVDDKIEKVNL